MTPADVKAGAALVRIGGKPAIAQALEVLADIAEAADAWVTESYEDGQELTRGNARTRQALAKLEAMKP